MALFQGFPNINQPFVGPRGIITQAWLLFLQQVTAGIPLTVVGPPPNTLGSNGQYAFRSDGVHATLTCIYHKEAGAWVGIA